MKLLITRIRIELSRENVRRLAVYVPHSCGSCRRTDNVIRMLIDEMVGIVHAGWLAVPTIAKTAANNSSAVEHAKPALHCGSQRTRTSVKRYVEQIVRVRKQAEHNPKRERCVCVACHSRFMTCLRAEVSAGVIYVGGTRTSVSRRWEFRRNGELQFPVWPLRFQPCLMCVGVPIHVRMGFVCNIN